MLVHMGMGHMGLVLMDMGHMGPLLLVTQMGLLFRLKVLTLLLQEKPP